MSPIAQALARWEATPAPALRLDCPYFVADCLTAHHGRDFRALLPADLSARDMIRLARIGPDVLMPCIARPVDPSRALAGDVACLPGRGPRLALGFVLGGRRAAFLQSGGGLIVRPFANGRAWRVHGHRS